MLHSIRSKLLLVIFLASFVPVLAITMANLTLEESVLKERIISELQTIVKDRSENINRVWQLRIEQASILANSHHITNLVTEANKPSPDPERLSALESLADQEITKFRQMTGGDEHGFFDFVIVDGANTVIHDVPHLEGRQLLPKVYDTDDAFFDIQPEPSTDTKSVLIVVTPIYSEGDSGQIIGKLVAKRDTYVAKTIIGDRTHLGETGEVYLVNANKEMVTESRFISNAAFNQIVDTEPVRKCLDEGLNAFGQWGDYRGKDGIPVFGASYCDRQHGYVLIAEQDVSEVFSPLLFLQTASAVMASIIIAASAGLAFVFSGSISNPILRLKKASQRISEGDYDFEINIPNKDEVGDLGRQFDMMRRQVLSANNDLNRKIEEKTAELEESNIDLQNKLNEIQNLQLTLDESSIVAITDRAGTITYANKKFFEISKYQKEDLIGKNHRILKSGYHDAEFYADLWTTISQGKIWRGEIKNRAKDGSEYWVKTVIVPFLDENGKPKQYIAIRTDITEQKKMQEDRIRLEKFAAIGELSARIAHDLRNPLAILKQTVSLMELRYKSVPSMSSELQRMHRAIDRMNHQIEDVLVFVRKSPLKIEKCSSSNLIKSTLEKIIIPASIKVDLAGNDIQFECDQVKIEALVVNLVINAIQAIGEQGRIWIRTSETDDKLVLEVEDSGPGIPEENMQKIFEPLFTTKSVGTGLGLSSCKNIVENHGGTIAVKTNPTVFIVTLPKIYSGPKMAQTA